VIEAHLAFCHTWPSKSRCPRSPVWVAATLNALPLRRPHPAPNGVTDPVRLLVLSLSLAPANASLNPYQQLNIQPNGAWRPLVAKRPPPRCCIDATLGFFAFGTIRVHHSAMHTTIGHRTLIIGNAGSGKSTLAQRLAARAGCPHISLDDVYWMDQTLLKKRGAAEAKQMLLAASLEPSWVIEGVFGWLAEVALRRASTLIWLDLPWIECESGLLSRGPLAGQTEAEFADLLAWSQLYWTRQSSSSHVAHRALYDAFAGEKVVLKSQDEIAALGGGSTLNHSPTAPSP
jgi:adenylate kinase family enzyme